MALMARSSEMSFSLSRLRSTLRSMYIAGRSKLRLRMLWVPELDLDSPRAQDGVAEPAAGLRVVVDVKRHPVRVGRDPPARGAADVGDRHPNQPAHRPPPVPRGG